MGQSLAYSGKGECDTPVVWDHNTGANRQAFVETWEGEEPWIGAWSVIAGPFSSMRTTPTSLPTTPYRCRLDASLWSF